MFSRREFASLSLAAACPIMMRAQFTPVSSPASFLRAKFDWYVDSVNGNDTTGNGKTAATAYATIGKLLSQTITAGQSIGLAAKSYWKELLNPPANNVSVYAYGQYAAPQTISAGSWTLTSGNVYQATLPFAGATWGGGPFIAAWEDSRRSCGLGGQTLGPIALIPTVTVALCQATVGSYCVSGTTIYVHALNDDSPATNTFPITWKAMPMLDASDSIPVDDAGWALVPGFTNTYKRSITLPATLGENRIVSGWENGVRLGFAKQVDLSIAMNTTDTSITFKSSDAGQALAQGFCTTGDTILLDNEMMLVTAVTGTFTRTVTRAQNGTSAANHLVTLPGAPTPINVTSCEATAGTMGAGSVAGTTTLIVHNATNTNPNGNHAVYEISGRNFGYDSDANLYSNCKVYGIAAQKQLSLSGAIRIGRFAYAQDCISLHGNKHNWYSRTGTSHMRCATLEYKYFSAIGALLFVYNEDNGAGEGVTFNYCQARSSTSATGSGASGFDGHTNVSGNFGTLAFYYCYAENMANGISSSGQPSNIINYCATWKCTQDAGGYAPLTMIGGSYIDCSGAAAVTAQNAGTYVFDGLTIKPLSGGSTSYAVQCLSAATLTVQNCDIEIATGSGACVNYNTSGGALNIQHNTFRTNAYYVISAGTPGSITLDFNSYLSSTGKFWHWNTASTDHSSSVFATYQSLSGLDANSTATP